MSVGSIGIKSLMVNNAFKYSVLKNDSSSSRKFYPITAMALSDSGFIAYGAGVLSDSNDSTSKSCPVIGVMKVTLTTITHLFTLTSGSVCSSSGSSNRFEKIVTDNQNYFYAISILYDYSVP